MILRFAAIAAWLVAAVFVNLIEPTLHPASFQTLLEKRQTVTVDAKVLSSPKEEKSFAGQQKYFVKIQVSSAGPLESRTGSMSGDSEISGLTAGSSIRAVISVRPAFRSDESFSSTLKALLDSSPSSQLDPLGGMRASFLANLSGVSSDSSALVEV